MISGVFIDRPRLAFVISIVITLAGLIAIGASRVAQFPDIVPPQVQVSGSYPGRQRRRRRADGGAADRAAGQRRRPHALHAVDLRLGRQLHADGHLRRSAPTPTSTPSTSRTGSTSPARSCRSEVSRQGLTIKKVSSALLQVVGALLAQRHLRPAVSCRNYATINILDVLKRINGVGDATLFGAARLLDAGLARPGSKLTNLRPHAERRRRAPSSRRTCRRRSGRIGAAPVVAGPAAPAHHQHQGPAHQRQEEFERIIVRANPDGSVVRVRDVARVELGAKSSDRFTPLQRPARGRDRHLSVARRQRGRGGRQRRAPRMAELKTRFPRGPRLRHHVRHDGLRDATRSRR